MDIIESYEGRIHKMRADMEYEKNEKFGILTDLNDLK